MQIVEKDLHCGCQLVCCRLLNFELRIIFVDSKVQYYRLELNFWIANCGLHISYYRLWILEYGMQNCRNFHLGCGL